MTEEDYQNLFFLLSISSETFNDWWDSADEDDRDYALSLLKMAEHEIIDIIQERQSDLSAARNVLAKIFK